MASISNSIAINDGFSSPLNNLSNLLQNATNRFTQLQNVMDRQSNFTGADNLKNDFNQASKSVESINRNINIVAASINTVNANINNVNASINNVGTNIESAISKQRDFNNTVRNGQNDADGLLGKMKGFVGAYLGIQGIKGIINTSDELTNTTARLNMMNDGLQTTAELQDMIFQSAQRSRAPYADTANAVAQLGIRAKDAFSNNEEVVAFSEQLNKMFTIAGASQQEMSSATLQLTQALGSGVLRGEEFNAVFEAAPNVMQSVAEYIGKPIGKLKDMASEGEITADIVKKAMFAAADETNAKFESMPMTWAQVWIRISNSVVRASQPILTSVNWIANNLDIIGPIILGIAGVVGVYMIATYGAAAATWVWTNAQAAFNAVMSLNPIALVIISIILLIAIIYAATAAVNKFTGTTYSATGLIAGAFFALGASIYNVIAYLWNVVASFVEFFANVFTNPIYSVKALFANLATNVLDMCISMTSGFDNFATNMANAIISGINLAINAWNSFVDLLSSFGIADKLGLSKGGTLNYRTSITSDLQGMKGQVNDWLGDAPNNYWTAPKMEMKSLGSSFDSGYSWGTGIGNNISKYLNGDGNGFDWDNLANNVGDIAGNTKDTNKKLDITEEDLKYLRDVAERDIINRFTTAEIKVDMTNHNTITNDTDIDGIANKLNEILIETMNSVAEGVS